MIKINPLLISQIREAVIIDELFPMLQKAIELEHSTIPPYLTALFCFKQGTEKEIRVVIHSIVIEEMLHMSIDCNILNALGGHPDIDKKDFVPNYPGPLPMGIGGDLIVGLQKYSKEVVKNTFMKIEEPDDPIIFERMLMAGEAEYKTIGDFYNALADKIKELAPDVLPGDPRKQVTSRFFPSDQLFPIIRKEDALRAIKIIIEQGEGTKEKPTDQAHELAHYYKFEELYEGRRLVVDPKAKNGYSFTGPVIPFDPANVYPLFPNTKAALLAPGTEERRRLDEFNNAYRTLLNGLHRTFNWEPDFLSNTIGVMFDLRLYAEKLSATPFPGKEGYHIGPSFEYIEG